MLKVGDKAPPFTLEADGGGTVALKDLKGKPVVLYFYPRDDTSGCTTEACEFRDNWKAVQARGAVVLGVSPDTVSSHDKFKAKYKLPFTLLADPDHALAAAYGAWGERSMYGRTYMGIVRSTFIIDPAGRISAIFRKVKPKGHAAEVLTALDAS
ncbi:MAG TPA: thioredoxin-dependent thiol peroxidase [Gemmatimonadales bacterium]|nr:thioredoxin-dependent thiol peroxidase [Gemmatimonadales bacterium]